MSRSFHVESEFDYKGFKCVVVFQELGHRCGYVGVPQNHPLYGKGYREETSILLSALENEEVGKRSIISLVVNSQKENITLDLLFDVHGSLTFSDGGKDGKYPIESDLWWLGFDCGHCEDGIDLDKAIEYFPERKEMIMQRKTIDETFGTYEGLEIRSQEYVENECRNLVDQIIKYYGSEEN